MARPQALHAPIVLKGFHLLLGLVIAGFICEGFARVFFPQWAPRTGAITRFWRYDPTLGWSHIPNSRGPFNAYGFESFVSINSKGFRDKERSYERDLSKYRIVVLGDSMVWGYGVQREEIFTGMIEKKSREAEVINLGVSGYGTDQELLLLRQEGVRYQPDLIILVISENDFLTNVQRVFSLSYHKPLFEFTSDGSVVLTNTPVPKQRIWSRMASSLIRSSYLLNRTAQEFERFRSQRRVPWPPNRKDPIWKRPFPRTLKERITLALLLEMQREAQKVEAEFLVIVTAGFGRLGEEMEYFFKTRQIRVLNLGYVFPTEKAGELHIPDGVHWSALGHEKVADYLLTYLKDENLLPISSGKRLKM